MDKKVTDELLSTVRSVIGQNYSDMDIIRALHMAKNDVTAAINIIFDTPKFGVKMGKNTDRSRRVSSSVNENVVADSKRNDDGTTKCSLGNGNIVSSSNGSEEARKCSLDSIGNFVTNPSNFVDNSFEDSGRWSGTSGSEWWLLGCSELAGLSTCKGRRIRPGDEVFFTFPSKKMANSSSPGKLAGRGRQVGACSEIVRFSTKESGEVI